MNIQLTRGELWELKHILEIKVMGARLIISEYKNNPEKKISIDRHKNDLERLDPIYEKINNAWNDIYLKID
jgi:hypothetical protein